MTVGEIARSAELTPATVTVMIDQLEAANIVQRTRSTEDRRVCNVSLTAGRLEPAGAEAQPVAGPLGARARQVSDEELETAVRVIRHVTGDLRRA